VLERDLRLGLEVDMFRHAHLIPPPDPLESKSVIKVSVPSRGAGQRILNVIR
jgi:hypothetical protein